jgi:tetratricopeptide (TPR) repeat protein
MLVTLVQSGCGGSASLPGADPVESIRRAETERIRQQVAEFEKNSQFVYRNGKIIDQLEEARKKALAEMAEAQARDAERLVREGRFTEAAEALKKRLEVDREVYGGVIERDKIPSQFTLLHLAEVYWAAAEHDLALQAEAKWFELAWKDFGWTPVIREVDPDGTGIGRFYWRDETEDLYEQMLEGSPAFFLSKRRKAPDCQSQRRDAP